MSETFSFDVFLSHSSKDKPIARAAAERLKNDGVRVWFDDWEIQPGDSIPSKIEEGLEKSRVIAFFMSANSFGSEWTQLEYATFRFRDPLNKHRRFVPLRLDESEIRGSLAQFRYINWLPSAREKEYPNLLEACRPSPMLKTDEASTSPTQFARRVIELDHEARIWAFAFSRDGRRVASAGYDHMLRLWDMKTGQLQCTLRGHTAGVMTVVWSDDQQYILSGGDNGDDSIRLWDIATGKCLREIKAYQGYVKNIAWGGDQRRILSVGGDGTMRHWDLQTGRCIRTFTGHTGASWAIACSADGSLALSGSTDRTLRLWDVESGKCLHVLEGHTGAIRTAAWSSDRSYAASGSDDRTLRVWEVRTGKCLRVLRGHQNEIWKVGWSNNQRQILSGSHDSTVRLWDVETERCLRIFEGHVEGVRSIALSLDGNHVLSGDFGGCVRIWGLSGSSIDPTASESFSGRPSNTPEQLQYTNAKVLVVGDSGSGKSGLARRLATGQWKPSPASTVGAWCTQLKLPDIVGADGIEREIWLWDFGGQADQRLIHQLYLDRAALVLLVFDADREEVLFGLRVWQAALRRSIPPSTPKFLVAGRTDAGFRVSRSALQRFSLEYGFGYSETSAKEGSGCQELVRAILNSISWTEMEHRTSPRIFKLIKDEILSLRDAGQVLFTFKELREVLRQRMPLGGRTTEQMFSDEVLHTVIGLLDGPGVVKELEYGSYILLQPEWINIYAQAVIRTLRQEPSELGYLPLRAIAEGRLLFQTLGRDGDLGDTERLPAPEERVILREMEHQLVERGLCLRQGDKLVFPSHCGRNRPAVGHHPPVLVSYAVEGYLDDIYATLVVKLADSPSFSLSELWRDSADFQTLCGTHHMGITLWRESPDNGKINVYFGEGVSRQEQVIFANYIHAHLESCSDNVRRLRYYVCPYCSRPKGDPQVLMEVLLVRREQASVECDFCQKRFYLWDDLERTFASATVREQVEGLKASDLIRLDTRRKGKLLMLEVSARISSANQKCFEIPSTEDDGLEMEVEFTDDHGVGTGRRLRLHLKAGNSHLQTRVMDGVEIFEIHEQHWVDYWLRQPGPVMLVIGTFAKDDARLTRTDKLEFADVRWMEISSILRRESQKGMGPPKQIEFKGERLDMMSIHSWRQKLLV